MPSWIIHFSFYFPLVIPTHPISFFLKKFHFKTYPTWEVLDLWRKRRSPQVLRTLSPFQGHNRENKSWKTCFPLLLHTTLKILPKQCKAGTTGDKLSTGKEDCLTSLTQPGNLLWVVVLNGSSRHEKFVILGTVYLSGLLLWDLVIHHYTHTQKKKKGWKVSYRALQRVFSPIG